MKPVLRKPLCAKLRLRPGGHLVLRRPLLRRMNWTQKDVWLLEFEARRLILFRKPSEREWRIHRLRTRISSSFAALPTTTGFTPRTTAEFLAQKASRWFARAKESGLRCTLIQDHGLTEFGGVPTDTVVATGPATANRIDAITRPLGLL